jgi:photosystem II stability/assembly factor-like uncharacterized protein
MNHRFSLWLILLPLFVNGQTFHSLKSPMGVVTAAAADRNGKFYIGSPSGGVYVSADSGLSWNRVSLATLGTTAVYALTFTREGKLVAGTDQGGVRVLGPSNTWSAFNTGLPKAAGTNQLPNIRAITCDSSGRWFAGTRAGNLAPVGLFMAPDSNGPWSDISATLPTTEILSLITTPNGSVYCGTDGYGVYRYTGSAWTPVNTGLADLHPHTFAVTPAGDLCAGTNSGFAVLNSASQTWANYPVSTPAAPVLALAFDPSSPARVFAGLGSTQYQAGPLRGRIFVSTDTGKTWSDAAPSLITLRVRALAAGRSGILIAGAHGMHRSSDHGASWNPAVTGFKDGIPAIVGSGFAVTPSKTFVIGTEYGLFRSTDEGVTWTDANNGVKHPLIEFVFCDSLGYLFACGHALPRHESSVNRLYRSTNDGLSWDTVQVSADGIYSMIAQGYNNELFLAHGFGSQPPGATFIGSGLARSTDRGATWHDLPCYGGKGFATAVTKQGTVLFGGETIGVYRSTNGGSTWDTTVQVGPGGNMAPIIISPRGEIFTCSYSDHRIWFSDSASDGRSYINMTGAGFPMYTTANSFAWSSTGRMYVGMKGNPPNTGLYYIDGPVTATSTFTPVPAVYLHVAKMHWDEKGYLWIYGGGVLSRSDSVLTAPRTITGVDLSVELTVFTAKREGKNIRLDWETATEQNNHGFQVERSSADHGVSGTGVWTTAGFVEGLGTTNVPQSYTFVDREAYGAVRYRLKQVDRDGGYQYSSSIEVNSTAGFPGSIHLEQNHPNPFNPSTQVTFHIPVQARTMLEVFDVLGRRIMVLVNGEVEAGAHTVRVDGSGWASGVYIVRLTSAGAVRTMKMFLSK